MVYQVHTWEWERGVSLLVNEILWTVLFICDSAQSSPSSLCFLLASTLSPRLDTWLSHIPSATKLCCFYWWNIFFFLISLFLPSFWTHFLLTCGGCDSFQQSHLDCKLNVSYNEPSRIFLAGWIFLKHSSDCTVSVKNCLWQLSASGVSPGSQAFGRGPL